MLFLVPVRDYLFTLGRREWVMEIVLPLIVTAGIAKILSVDAAAAGLQDLRGAVINLLAIFVGFSITSLTCLVSSSNASIKSAKSRVTEHKIGNQAVTFFQYIHLTLSYSIIAQLLLLLLNVVALCARLDVASKEVAWFVALLNALFLLHVFAVNLRNVAYIYFLFWSHPEKPLRHD